MQVLEFQGTHKKAGYLLMLKQSKMNRARALLKQMQSIAPLRPSPEPDLPPAPSSAVRLRRSKFLQSRRGLAAGAGGQGAERTAQKRRGTILALVQRISQGFNQAEYDRAVAMGYDAYLEEQLDYLAIDDSAMEPRLANFPTLGMSPAELLDNFLQDNYIPFNELKGATLVRAVHSKRQLFERMCEFWGDHFSIDHRKGIEWIFKQQDDEQVTRKFALSSFPEILSASAHSAAMMFYLDNWLNFVGAPQENWARELMELHTLGVDGGYTEQDVKEVARVFTGWSLNFDDQSTDYLNFQFHAELHDPSPAVVLGNQIPAGSYQQAGEMVLTGLATHPSTARFLSTKMTRWLLSENPPKSVIDQVTATFLDTGGDIKAMIRVILSEENVRLVSGPFQPKFKRPFHYVTSLLRGLDAEVFDTQALLYFLQQMGHSPMDWPAPNGYPDTVNVWGMSLLPRWTFAANVMTNFVPGVQISLGKLNALLGDFNQPGLSKRISDRIFARGLGQADRQALDDFFSSRRPLVWPEVYEAIGFVASCPDNQWY